MPERNDGSVPERNDGSVPERNDGSVPERNDGSVPADTHIDLVRSGGMAGLSLGTSVDVSSLPPDAATAVSGALSQVDVGALARRPPAVPSGPDRFQYDLTVTKAGESQSVSLQESEVPADLRPLINALMPLAQPRP